MLHSANLVLARDELLADHLELQSALALAGLPARDLFPQSVELAPTFRFRRGLRVYRAPRRSQLGREYGPLLLELLAQARVLLFLLAARARLLLSECCRVLRALTIDEKVRNDGELEPTMYSSRNVRISQCEPAVPAPPPSSSWAPRSDGQLKWRWTARATRGVATCARMPDCACR